MRILLSSLILCFFVVGEHYGQSCGTKYVTPPRGWMQETQSSSSRSSNQPIEVLLKVHIVRRSNGTGGVSPEEVLVGVERANLIYQQAMNLTFKICPDIHYIDNTILYNNDVDVNALVHDFYPSRVPYAIDVFYTPITNPLSDGVITSWAYFPWESGDCIIMNNTMATLSTLTHELGHYLGLFHTHKETALLADGILNNHNANAVEYVDGRDCTTRGDGLCDTPADHGLGGRVTSDGQGNNCAYSGSIYYDLNGELFVPNVLNVMSYTNDDCRKMFSGDQVQRMLSVLQNDKATIYAHNNQPCPCENEPNSWIFEEVDYVGCRENIILWSRIITLPTVTANETITAKNIVSSTANVSYKAGQEIRLEPGFKVELGGVFKTQSQTCSSASCPNSNMPYISANTSSGISDAELTTEVDRLTSKTSTLKCYPNPTNHTLNIVLDFEKSSSVHLKLVDVNGRVVVELEEQQLSVGLQSYQIDTQELTAGIYMLVMRCNDETQTQKIVIQH